jgi:glycosyltransferase involved in cell wall biosynthesis
VSEEARAVAIETFAVPNERVTVIHHGGPLALVGPPRPRRPVRRLLVVSNIYRHKNIAVVIEALRSVTEPLDLTVVGDPIDKGHLSELRAKADDLPAGHQVRFVGPRYGADLQRHYAAADCLVWPSVAESFGLPLLEAHAHGLPILASDTSVSHEILGEGAVYFDPHSPEALAGALREAATHGLPRGMLPRVYSWDGASTRTAEVLRRAAGRCS